MSFLRLGTAFRSCLFPSPLACSALARQPTPLETHPQSRSVWGNLVKPNPRGRNRPNKHRDPRWRKMRGQKIVRIELPDYHRQAKLDSGEISPEEVRALLKKQGLLEPRTPEVEAPVFISSTGALIGEYEPPESDGYSDLMTKEGAKRQASKLTSKGKSFRATRKVRTYEDNFDPKNFGSDVGQGIYIEAHKALSEKKEKKLHELVTEKAFPEMMHNVAGKSMYWDFVKSLEPPRVVQVRVQDVINTNNSFGQVTVRFHTKQVLAVYDRFGRLIHGHPHVAKDVLEYVVFEKHLANLYGKWRLHAKIIPEWLNARKIGGLLTHVLHEDDLEQPKAEEQPSKKSDDEDDEEQEDAGGQVREQDQKYLEDKEEASIYDRFGKLIRKYKN